MVSEARVRAGDVVGQNRAYAAMMVSIICLCGLPMIVGVFLVEYRSGADIDPDPVA